MVHCGRYLAASTDLIIKGAAEGEEIVLESRRLESKPGGGHEACIELASQGDHTTAPRPMNDEQSPFSKAREGSASVASELNNLLEIIAGTSSLIENVWDGNDGADKYFSMLRASIDRAADITAELVNQAGGSDAKVLLHPELAAFATRRKAPEAPARKRTVLAVDDEPMNVVLSKRILSNAGFEVVTAQSGFECLDLFRKAPASYDLVMLDLSMPFMDGEETFARLKQLSPNVVVLLSTGFVEQERLDRMLAAGMSGFLRKPHRPAELVAHVNAVLQSVNLSRFGCAVSAVG
jgi:CheY-like chemotaxis protein